VEDIVVVAIELQEVARRFFLTWGRIQDSVEPGPLKQLVFKHCTSYDLGGTPMRACLCGTLREAVDAPYFYEYFFMIGQQTIPFGKKYQKWKKHIHKKMQDGKELYYLGNPERFTSWTRKTEVKGSFVCILDLK
jgi:hypothetical protein